MLAETIPYTFPHTMAADGDSLMCCIVIMGRQIAKMFSTFSLGGSLFLMVPAVGPTNLHTKYYKEPP